MGMEEHEFDGRRVVGAAHAIGLAPVARRQMVEHIDHHGGDAPGFRVDQLRPVGAVDHAGRADRRSRSISRGPATCAISFSSRGPTPGKRARLGKKGKQNRTGAWGVNDNRGRGSSSCGHWQKDGFARYIQAHDNTSHGGSQEVRRKQLLFRCQRRGFKEVDLIFGTFAAREIGTLDDRVWTSLKRC